MNIPFIGLALYFNQKYKQDNTYKEFLWCKDEIEAEEIMKREYPDSNKIVIKPFLTL
jgi:hypothetical protein